jgi:hypothetical protein
MAKRSFLDYISQGMEMGLRYQQMADEKQRRKEELLYRRERDEKDDKYRDENVKYQKSRDDMADERYKKEFALKEKEFEANKLARDITIAATKQQLTKGYRTKAQAEAMGYGAGGYLKDTDIEGKVGMDFLPEGEYISNDVLDDWYKKRQLDLTEQNIRMNAGALNDQRKINALLLTEKLEDIRYKQAVRDAAVKSNAELPKLQQQPIVEWGASGNYLKAPEGTDILSSVTRMLSSKSPDYANKAIWDNAKKRNTDKAAEYIDKYVNPILNMRDERLKLGLATNDLDVVISNIQPALTGIYASFDKGYSYSKSGNRRVKADVYNALQTIESITKTNRQQVEASLQNMIAEQSAKAQGRTMGNAWGREH